jgi:hypothetical protein
MRVVTLQKYVLHPTNVVKILVFESKHNQTTLYSLSI